MTFVDKLKIENVRNRCSVVYVVSTVQVVPTLGRLDDSDPGAAVGRQRRQRVENKLCHQIIIVFYFRVTVKRFPASIRFTSRNAKCRSTEEKRVLLNKQRENSNKISRAWVDVKYK